MFAIYSFLPLFIFRVRDPHAQVTGTVGSFPGGKASWPLPGFPGAACGAEPPAHGGPGELVVQMENNTTINQWECEKSCVLCAHCCRCTQPPAPRRLPPDGGPDDLAVCRCSLMTKLMVSGTLHVLRFKDKDSMGRIMTYYYNVMNNCD